MESKATNLPCRSLETVSNAIEALRSLAVIAARIWVGNIVLFDYGGAVVVCRHLFQQRLRLKHRRTVVGFQV